jgi:S1-C subfamily serine protease
MQQAGFEDGDVLIAVDGKDPADATALRAAISAALARKRVAVALLREGRRVELTVDGTSLANPFELGASLSPTTR